MLRTFPNDGLAGRREVGRERPSTHQPGTLPPQQPLLRRMWKHRYLMHYHRLIALVVMVNLVLLGYGLMQWQWWTAESINLTALSNLVVANIGSDSVSILIGKGDGTFI